MYSELPQIEFFFFFLLTLALAWIYHFFFFANFFFVCARFWFILCSICVEESLDGMCNLAISHH